MKERETRGVDIRRKLSGELIVCLRKKRDGSGHVCSFLKRMERFSFSERLESEKEDL